MWGWQATLSPRSLLPALKAAELHNRVTTPSPQGATALPMGLRRPATVSSEEQSVDGTLDFTTVHEAVAVDIRPLS